MTEPPIARPLFYLLVYWFSPLVLELPSNNKDHKLRLNRAEPFTCCTSGVGALTRLGVSPEAYAPALAVVPSPSCSREAMSPCSSSSTSCRTCVRLCACACECARVLSVSVHVHVCVCVCVRESERKRERDCKACDISFGSPLGLSACKRQAGTGELCNKCTACK